MVLRSLFQALDSPASQGGIKAQLKRGNFGENWWAKRWIEVLESFHIGARLNRGRSYARQDQVLSIEIEKGKVTAKVQGSHPKPYEIKLQMKALSSAQWQKMVRSLSKKAIYTAKLLAGEMSSEIEKAFLENGISLFPTKGNDLKTECSCPDWSNPCKHIAAVYYLLGEEFDRNPFLIFKLRGMTREELLKSLKPKGKAEVPRRGRGKAAAPSKMEEPLPLNPDAYWNGRAIPDDFLRKGDPSLYIGTPPPMPRQLSILERRGKIPRRHGKILRAGFPTGPQAIRGLFRKRFRSWLTILHSSGRTPLSSLYFLLRSLVWLDGQDSSGHWEA